MDGFDPDAADTLAAARRTSAPILIVHGAWDLVVPFEHGRRLHEASGPDGELLALPLAGHLSLHFADTTTRIQGTGMV